MEALKCFFPPYEGDEPFIFFSYCHSDENIDYAIIDRLGVDGYRVWYDDGIHPGSDWPEIIAEHLEKSAVCIAAVSSNSADSANCKNEMTYAINAQKPLVPVILENFSMTRGLKMQINSREFIKFFEYTNDIEAFFTRLEKMECLSSCRSKTAAPSVTDIRAWTQRVAKYSSFRRVEKNKSDFGLIIQDFGKKTEVERRDDEHEEAEGKASGARSAEEPAGKNLFRKRKEKSEEKSYLKEVTYVETKDEDVTEVEDNGDEATVVEDAEHTVIEDEEGTVIEHVEKKLLAVIIQRSTAQVFPVTEEETAIGRSGEMADICVQDPTNRISKHHADLICRSGRYALKDNGSSNKTYHAGAELGDSPVPLREIDSFTLVGEEFLFIGERELASFRASSERGVLATLTALETGEIKILAEETVLLDRHHAAQWEGAVLSSNRVSREKMCTVSCDWGKYRFENTYRQEKKNRCFLNGAELPVGESRPLSNGDVLSVAGVDQFRFEEIKLN